mmetsp:Transcript_34684/g.75911  ORF Transcript_34684/g.75911 Transcript_34684/m.75911 type:complete len:202 (-) Transcript_34684:127-732(-)
MTDIVQHRRTFKEWNRRFQLLDVANTAQIHVCISKPLQKGIIMYGIRSNILTTSITSGSLVILFNGLKLTCTKVKWQTMVIVQSPNAMASCRFKHIVPLQSSSNLKILRENGQRYGCQMPCLRGGRTISNATQLEKTKNENEEGRFVSSTIIQTNWMTECLVEIGTQFLGNNGFPLLFICWYRYPAGWGFIRSGGISSLRA